MRNIKSNHRGLSGWNLRLNNEWVMYKYYFRNRKNVEYPIRWIQRTWHLIQAAVIGWTPWEMRREKNWAKYKIGGSKYKGSY